ncbi:MAG: hypothetical protein HY785_27700 [Oscillatoriophycideae cyanobacterium NC_groundwater_1537_Pr4_S-0.65um_50_18]|nr:hypothetical protein [Oscillatoriophycideae cyanobacterium NC_groundwater_1537_Pr4_S-0.65um_50_18]
MKQMDWISWILKMVQIGCAQSPEDLSSRSYGLSRPLVLMGLILLTLGYSPLAQAEVWVGDRANDLRIAAEPEIGNGDRLTIPADAVEIPVGSPSEQSWAELPPPEQPVLEQPILEQPALAAAAPSTPPEPATEKPPIALALLQTIQASTLDETGNVEPAPAEIASTEAASTEAASTETASAETAPAETSKRESVAKPLELAFGLPPSSAVLPQVIPAASTPVANVNLAAPLADLFVGNSDSLVAKAVGSAEGTRTPEGDRNPAYFGHVDPGNKAWNLGSFSYQHGATTPEEADVKQLNRLQAQASVMQAKAEAKGISLTLEEALNGIDLANQAPKAVLDREGYIDWLAKARQNGLSGSDAVLWARTQSFFDPNLQRWDAPGLGNTEERISSDQERRMLAINRAIAVYKQSPLPSNSLAVASPSPVAPPTAPLTASPTHKLPQDLGIARLFAQAMTDFGSSVLSSGSDPLSGTATRVRVPEKNQTTDPSDPAALPEAPNIAALLGLDL